MTVAAKNLLPLFTAEQAKTLSSKFAAENEILSEAAKALPRFEVPLEIGWSSEYKLEAVQLPDGTYTSLTDPKRWIDPRVWNATAYYVDSATGSNSNSGLTSFTNALASINVAITKGNATNAPYRVFVKGGHYCVNDSINGYPAGWPTPPVSALIEPTQPCAFIAVEGRVRHSAQLNVTYPTVKDGTYTNCYAISNCAGTRRVFNRTTFDAYGGYTELTNAADLATCNATANSWYQSGSTLYINQTTAPTASNTGIYANLYVASFLTCRTDLYFEGFDFEGGSNGAFHVDVLAERNIVMVNCTANYAGASATLIDGFRIRRVSGLVAMYRCSAQANAKDGFNFHADGAVNPHVLTVNCYAIDNGRYASTSNNGLTGHDNLKLVDIGSYYGFQLVGASVHHIEDTRSWCLGTIAERNATSGSNANSAFKVSNNGIMYLENCQAYSENAANYSVIVQAAASKLYYSKLLMFVATQQVDGGCIFSEYFAAVKPIIKVNALYSSRAVAVTDDVTKGYYPGSIFIDKAAGTCVTCITNATGAAVWA